MPTFEAQESKRPIRCEGQDRHGRCIDPARLGLEDKLAQLDEKFNLVPPLRSSLDKGRIY